MIGTKLDHYEITGHLGSGGMGEVYQATDSKLGRNVAIKVLPDTFASDSDRRARFEREARMLASLNHPHIAAIYGLEESGGRNFLVMELVTGETLAQRIARSSIAVYEAIALACQIAQALEAAHEKGVMHRDLKPANIKVTTDGQIKVLDFGLAKAFAGEMAEPMLSNSPTLSRDVTNAGVILGTASYMSPEQAQGKEVDRRTDIFAFGCVIYEMLTGRRAFEGDTVTEILAGVLKSEPDWSRLPSDTPHSVQRLLRRCLHKDRNHRMQYAADLKIELEEAQTETALPKPTVTVSLRRTERFKSAALILLAVALVAAVAVPYFRTPATVDEMRVDIVTPSTPDPLSFAISPDGRRIVFLATGGGQPRLWLRSLDNAAAQPMAGTEGASFPFWSPDSKSVAFFAEGKLKRVDVGGVPQTLANAPTGRGGAWASDGSILFSPTGAGPIARVPASGGTAVPLTRLAANQSSHRFPKMLPDGRRFVFYGSGTTGTRGIYLGSIDSAETRFLVETDIAASYIPGWLMSVRQGTLVAWRFDPSVGEVMGDAVTVADPVGFDIISVAGAFSVSATGTIAYRSATPTRRQLTWFDRFGKVLGTAGPADETGLADPELSPDGKRIAVDRTVQNNIDVYLLEGSRRTRFTFNATQESLPIWSPDQSRIIFRSGPKGVLNLYHKPASGAGTEELIVESDQHKSANDWSADGRFMLYHSVDTKTDGDLWVLPMEKDAKPSVFLNTSADERAGQFSPDGRWVAYQSNASGQFEIYIRPFPGPGGQWQVSMAGGIQARWRHDGKELYYLAPDGKLMAAAIAVKGTIVEPGEPVSLFQPPIAAGVTSAYRAQYDVAPDGRFLVNVTAEDAAAPPITLLLNWRNTQGGSQ